MIEFKVPSLVPRSLLSFVIYITEKVIFCSHVGEPGYGVAGAHYFTTYRFSLIS